MKIAMIGQKGLPAHSGGVERHVDYLATRLAREMHEVFVYCRKTYAHTKNIKKNYQGVRLITVPTLPGKHVETPLQTLLASIHVLFQDVDLIHYHGIGPALFLWIPRLFKPRARVIATFHCQDYYQQKWNWFARAAFYIGEWFACVVAHRTIVVSRHLQSYVKERYGRDAVYIPNAVPLFKRRAANAIRSSWGLERGSFLLCVSRLVRHKGIHTVIKAYADAFVGCRHSPKLVIVGESAHTDKYVRELKSLVGTNSNILFLGEQGDDILGELYSNAMVFVQASESEGLSYALLEAMSYGSPVVVSDIAQHREVLPAIGRTFRVSDSADLTRCLREIAKDGEVLDHSISAVRAHIDANYNLDSALRDTVSFYREEAPLSSFP